MAVVGQATVAEAGPTGAQTTLVSDGGGRSAPARAGRPRHPLSRLSSGHAVMLLAGALGVLLTLTLLRDAQHTQPVLVAAHDLAPGTVLGDGAVRVARVHADGSVLATLYSTDAGSVRNAVVTRVVHAGEPLLRSDVAAGDRVSPRTMSFAIARARAVDGRLAAGDRVDVLAVEHDSGHAGYVMTNAEVVGVDSHSATLGASSDDATVTLVVDAEHAPRLAAALESGNVVLVRSTGAAPFAAGTPELAPKGTP